MIGDQMVTNEPIINKLLKCEIKRDGSQNKHDSMMKRPKSLDCIQ
jgi:hypothetical protein